LGGWNDHEGKNIAYWTTTILIAFFIGSGGGAQIAQYLGNRHGVVPVLGYPIYFTILGFWKVLGAIAILVPRYPRLKEWAYAGIFFDLTGAVASVVCGRRLRRLRVSHPRSTHPYWYYCGIVGASAGEPYHRYPHSSDKRQAGINTRATVGKPGSPWACRTSSECRVLPPSFRTAIEPEESPFAKVAAYAQAQLN